MGSKGGSTQVTGYRYFMSMLMGLCRGPIDSIVSIKIGDLFAWVGVVDENEDFFIDADNLFGGDDKEGGVSGTVTASFGAPDQDISGGPIPGIIGGLISDLRGVTTLFLNDGHICSNNPYPKAWTVRARRALKGWFNDAPWYPDEAQILLFDGLGNSIVAMNPAHIIYECLTNPVWGRGLPVASLDNAAFTSAANVLCREQFGLCLLWQRSTDLGPFVQLVVDHIGAALYIDRETGLMTLRLLRGDYDPATLPVFGYETGLLKITEDTSTAPDNSHSELIVNWVDPVTNGARQTRIQNLAGIQADQTVASTSTDYLGLPNSDLAARIAQRDMMIQGSGIRRFTLVLDRRGRKIAPAGVFRINVPDRGIVNMVLRAGRVEEGPVTGQTVTVTAVQDVFSLETTTYLIREVGSWVRPDREARAVDPRRLDEMTYRDTVRLLSAPDLALVAVDSGAIVAFGEQPTGLSVDYILSTHAPGEAYADHGRFSWTPTATLTSAIGYYTTAIAFATADGLNRVGVGEVAWLENECVTIIAIDAGAMTASIGRGSVDTVPVPHAAGARIWFPDGRGSGDGREYTVGETVDVKMRTRTNSAALSLTDAPEDAIVITARQGRPYPPGDLQTNGDRFGDLIPVTGDIVFTWAHRDRLTQADHTLIHGDASTGPEAGTTYTIRMYDGVTLFRTTSGISAATWTYDSTMLTADGSIIHITIELESVRDGIVSHQKYRWTLTHAFPGGFDFDFDNYFG